MSDRFKTLTWDTTGDGYDIDYGADYICTVLTIEEAKRIERLVGRLNQELNSMYNKIEHGEETYRSRMLLVKAGINEMQSTIDQQAETIARLQAEIAAYKDTHEALLLDGIDIPTSPDCQDSHASVNKAPFDTAIDDTGEMDAIIADMLEETQPLPEIEGEEA